MSRLERSQKIAQFVIKRLEDTARQNPAAEHDPVYRWEHTLRVAQYGEQIALAEGAEVEVVVTACTLHDVAHFEAVEDYRDHGREGARISQIVGYVHLWWTRVHPTYFFCYRSLFLGS